jgi:hypothetical protein
MALFVPVDEVAEQQGEAFGVAPGQYQTLQHDGRFAAVGVAAMGVEAEVENPFLPRTAGAKHVGVRCGQRRLLDSGVRWRSRFWERRLGRHRNILSINRRQAKNNESRLSGNELDMPRAAIR